MRIRVHMTLGEERRLFRIGWNSLKTWSVLAKEENGEPAIESGSPSSWVISWDGKLFAAIKLNLKLIMTQMGWGQRVGMSVRRDLLVLMLGRIVVYFRVETNVPSNFFKICVRIKFLLYNILPELVWIWNNMYEIMCKTFLEVTFMVRSKFFVCAHFTTCVGCAHTHTA